MANIDNLSVSFGADFRGLIAEMKKAEGATAQFRGKIEKDMAGAKAAMDKIKTAAAAALGGFGVAKIAAMTRDALAFAAALDAQAKALDVSAERLQEWSYAASQAGLETGKLGDTLTAMRGKLAEAASGKGEVSIFQQVGLDLRDASGQLKSLDDQLPAILEKMRALGKGDQLVFGKALGIPEAQMASFVRLAAQGADGLKRAGIEGRNLGVVMTNEVAAKGAALHKSVEALTDAVGKNLKAAFISLGPELEKILRALADMSGWVARTVDRAQNMRRNEGDMLKRAKEEAELNGLRRKAAGPRGLSMEEFAKLQALEAQPKVDAWAKVNQGMADAEWRVQKPDTLKGAPAAAESELSKKLKEIADAAKIARAELELSPKNAAWEPIRLQLEKLTKDMEVVTAAKLKFDETWNTKAAIAVKDMGRENEDAIAMIRAEATGRREIVLALQMEQQLKRNFGPEAAALHSAEIQRIAAVRAEAEKSADQMREIAGTIQSSLVAAMQDATALLIEFAETGKVQWQKFGEIALGTLQKIMSKLAEMAMNEMFAKLIGNVIGSVGNIAGAAGGIGGGFGGGSMGSIGALFGGPRAEGGPVLPGVAYLVGEKRPELFLPDAPGRIIPRVPDGGMGGAVTYIDARGADAAGLARLEAVVKAQGSDMRRWQAGESMRVVAHVVDAKRRGGAVANAFGR